MAKTVKMGISRLQAPARSPFCCPQALSHRRVCRTSPGSRATSHCRSVPSAGGPVARPARREYVFLRIAGIPAHQYGCCVHVSERNDMFVTGCSSKERVWSNACCGKRQHTVGGDGRNHGARRPYDFGPANGTSQCARPLGSRAVSPRPKAIRKGRDNGNGKDVERCKRSWKRSNCIGDIGGPGLVDRGIGRNCDTRQCRRLCRGLRSSRCLCVCRRWSMGCRCQCRRDVETRLMAADFRQQRRPRLRTHTKLAAMFREAPGGCSKSPSRCRPARTTLPDPHGSTPTTQRKSMSMGL